MEIRHDEIVKKLAHRYPFLLVDRVIEYTPSSEEDIVRVGRKIKAIKNVTINEPFFQGHFPDNPIMPGVLQVEAMAQAGAISCVPYPGEAMDVMIAKIDKAKFRKPVVPGDQLVIETEVILEKSSMLSIQCYAFVDGKVVAEALLMAKVFPKKNEKEDLA